MFSQYGRAAVLIFYDKQGAEVGRVARYWSRQRKTTRNNATYFRFRVADLKTEFAAAMRAAGDGGTVGVLGERYRLTKVEGWKAGESRIWTLTGNAVDAPTSEFFQAP